MKALLMFVLGLICGSSLAIELLSDHNTAAPSLKISLALEDGNWPT